MFLFLITQQTYLALLSFYLFKSSALQGSKRFPKCRLTHLYFMSLEFPPHRRQGAHQADYSHCIYKVWYF